MRREDEQQGEEQTAASFPEDVLIEILSRVPYMSLCRFKCVSTEWLALCSDSNIRKRSPQTLSGFFYFDLGWRFHNLSGKGPPTVDPDLHFLRDSYKYFSVEQCSTSLLLCKCWKSPHHKQQHRWNFLPNPGPGQCSKWPEANEFDYVVCNPATHEWTVLPPIELPNHLQKTTPQNEDLKVLKLLRLRFSLGKYCLGFDPSTPSRFVVFVNTNYGLPTEMVYSSETGGWTSMQSQCDDVGVNLVSNLESTQSTFMNDRMHFPTRYSSIVTLDMKREAWREIIMPSGMTNNGGNASIGQSQGRLYAWHIENQNDCQLSVWVLENYDSGQLTLKWVANCFELFGRDCCENGKSYSMFAIHPECNLIFLTDSKEKILSYDMDNQKVHVICTSGKFLEGLPYTPCFAEWTSDGQ